MKFNKLNFKNNEYYKNKMKKRKYMKYVFKIQIYLNS